MQNILLCYHFNVLYEVIEVLVSPIPLEQSPLVEQGVHQVDVGSQLATNAAVDDFQDHAQDFLHNGYVLQLKKKI